MARKQTPCEFCDPANEGNFIELDIDGLSFTAEKYPDNNFIGMSIIGLSSDDKEVEEMYQFEMNYCPVCGRKLNG